MNVECPGCATVVAVECNLPVRVEWDRLFDGRFLGWLICDTREPICECHITVDDVTEHAWYDHPEMNGYGRQVASIHECSEGGEAGDRAGLRAPPPSRSTDAP